MESQNWSTPFNLRTAGAQNIIVHTPTRDSAEELQRMLDSIGWHCAGLSSRWDRYKEETAYCLFTDTHIEYGDREFYEMESPYRSYSKRTLIAVDLDDFDVPDVGVSLLE